MVANIVPLRRFDPKHDWFTYSLPTSHEVVPGQLVSIPFRNQNIPGIVWEISNKKPSYAVKPIADITSPSAVMTDWQMQTIQIIAENSAVSLGHLVRASLPDFGKQDLPIKLPGKSQDQKSTLEQHLWYRDRREARTLIRSWLNPGGSGTNIVITPTINDADQLATTLPKATVVSSKLTPAQYRKLYLDVLSGQTQNLLGTSRLLYLPYPERPNILIDQVEHPAHKQFAQHPRVNVASMLELIDTPYTTTSPAPIVVPAVLERTPPAARGARKLFGLDKPRDETWISHELSLALDQVSVERPLVLISPHNQFSPSVYCATCHFAWTCQHCQHPLGTGSLNQASVECPRCQRVNRRPTTCPACQGVDWKLTGIGVPKLVELLKQGWPKLKVSTSWPPLTGSHVWLGTYQAYRWLTPERVWEATVVVAGDALRSWPDFSADERSWQFLARLQAQNSKVPVWVQTFSPNDDFWQRWLHTDDQAWYTHELKARSQFNLPPEYDQWIAYHPPAGADPAVEALLKDLSKYPDLQTRQLPANAKKNARVLIQSTTKVPLRRKLHWREQFPSPWQLDPHPRSWVE